MKKCIPLLLILSLCLSLCACAKPVTGADYPAVFVHGYSGWGSYDERDKSTPYWGLGSTNVKNSLTNRGFRFIWRLSVPSRAHGIAPASYTHS